MKRNSHVAFALCASIAACLFLSAAPPQVKPLSSYDPQVKQLLAQMTLDEKLGLVHGGSAYSGQATPQPTQSLGGAGFIPGIPRFYRGKNGDISIEA